MNDSTMDFVKYVFKKSLIKAKTFQIIFWTLTLFSLLFGFFSTLMGVFKLASSRLKEFDSFAKLFVIETTDATGKITKVDQWPIFTLWIGIAISIVNGLVALFLVRKKWIRNKRVYNLIELEILRYKENSPKYQKAESKNLLLFESVNAIVGNNERLLGRGDE